jgi:hypothetical protein
VAIGTGAAAIQDNSIALGGFGTTTQVQALSVQAGATLTGGQTSISWAGGNTGSVTTLNSSNAALSVTNGAVISNGLQADMLHVTGTSQFDGNVAIGTQATMKRTQGARFAKMDKRCRVSW